jgi:HK97 family phage major capsid protein
MAITAARTLSDFSGFISRDQSDWIFQKAAQTSVVQSLARRVPLAASGQSIPVVTGKPTAGWVAEGAQKPATQGTVTLKTMDPKKLAAIAVVSAEVVRANPANYISLLREEIAEAFAIAFDSAALHGTSTPFSTNLDTGSSTQEFTGTAPAFTAVWADLNAGLSTLVSADKTPTGWALDRRLEPVLNAVVDSAGRPLFIESPLTETNGPVSRGRLMSRPAVMGTGIYTSGPKIYAYLGDWTQVAWGAVGEISYKVSTEAAVTINGALVSLFENNLVAILAEAEYGFLVNDAAAFVKYTNAT